MRRGCYMAGTAEANRAAKRHLLLPCVAEVRCTLFVVTVSSFHADEAVPLVKPPGAEVALERPQLQTIRTRRFRYV